MKSMLKRYMYRLRIDQSYATAQRLTCHIDSLAYAIWNVHEKFAALKLEIVKVFIKEKSERD